MALLTGGMSRKKGRAAKLASLFNSLPDLFRLLMMMYVNHLLSFLNVDAPPSEHDIDLCHETVRLR